MRAVLSRAGLAAALVSLVSLATATALAQPKPLPEAQARVRLEAFNAELERAASVLHGSYGANPAAEQERITQAASISAGIAQALGEELASAGAAYEIVKANHAALEAELGRARLAQRYSAAEAAVRARHAAGQPASDQEWSALGRALEGLEAKATGGWQATVAHFRSRLSTLEADRALLAAKQAPAAPEPEPEPLRAEPPSAATTDALLEAFRAANRERRSLERLLEDSEEPLPADALAAYLAAASRVSALSERAGRHYTTVYRQLLVANAFRQPDEEAFATLPNLYQGELVAHGSARGRLNVSLTAKEDHCYALVARFQRYSGAEGLARLRWTPRAKGTGLSRFDVPHAGPGHQLTEGVCPTRSTRLTVRATLEGAARDNPLRYVIVSWPKEALPLFVASYLRVLDVDRCDDEAWQRVWTRPLPGSLLYRGQEPWLVVDASRPPSDELVIVNANGARATVKKSELRGKAPKQRAFTTTFAYEGCPALTGAGSPEANRLSKCLARVEKKYAKSVEREEGWVERAKTESARERAEARLASLRERWAKERAKQCDPLEERLSLRMQRTFERVLDLHSEHEVIAPFDRADQLQAEQEAQPDLR